MSNLQPITQKDLFMMFHKEFGSWIDTFDVDERNEIAGKYLAWLEEELLKRMNCDNLIESFNSDVQVEVNSGDFVK